MAQVKAATTRAITPHGSSAALPWDRSKGPISRAMPPKPTSTPNQVSQLARGLPGMKASSSTSQSGVAPMKSEAMPEGMRCSAHTRLPLPPSSISGR
jgi:hypothetical protein